MDSKQQSSEEEGNKQYLDLRRVIGTLLTFYGLIITVYGIFAHPSKKVLDGFNIDFWWGVVILLCGLAFLYFSFREKLLYNKGKNKQKDRS